MVWAGVIPVASAVTGSMALGLSPKPGIWPDPTPAEPIGLPCSEPVVTKSCCCSGVSKMRSGLPSVRLGPNPPPPATSGML